MPGVLPVATGDGHMLYRVIIVLLRCLLVTLSRDNRATRINQPNQKYEHSSQKGKKEQLRYPGSASGLIPFFNILLSER